MSRPEEAILLASGGLDSTTLCYELLRDSILVRPLFIDYGQHCAETELATLRDVLPPGLIVHVVDVSDLYAGTESRLIKEADLWNEAVGYEELFLPYRSLLLLTLGSAFAQARGVNLLYAAFINSNHAAELDCSLDFFRRLDPLLSEYGSVQLRLPYRDWTKAEVAKRGVQLGAPIGKTFSCQVSASVPCGACPNCVDRLDSLGALPMEIGIGR
jgi:7-cyano-7-deazaguanine synthase